MKDVIHIDKEIQATIEEHQEEAPEILQAIALRVKELMDTEPGLLFSYLYRLDVQEAKVRAVMTHDSIDQVQAIADLIYERQKQRLYTKQAFKQKPIDGWEW